MRDESAQSRVYLLSNGAIVHKGRMVARVVYASPELAETMRAAVEREFLERADSARPSPGAPLEPGAL